MKSTPSKDGKPRYTFTVPFRLGAQDMKDCLLSYLCGYGESPNTKTQAVRMIKSALRHYGGGAWLLCEEATEEQKTVISRMVSEWFPDAA